MNVQVVVVPDFPGFPLFTLCQKTSEPDRLVPGRIVPGQSDDI